MGRSCDWPQIGLILVACSSVALAASGHAMPKQDRAWKRYQNAEWGYCFNYPSRWVKGDAFDGAGLFVKSGHRNTSRPLGAIDVGVLPVPKQESARLDSVSLIDNFKVHLEGLKRFERAEKMEVLETRNTQLAGAQALYTKDQYYDPLDRSTWIDEIIFASRNQTLFRLELASRADQLTRFESVFSHLVSTFQFTCDTAPR